VKRTNRWWGMGTVELPAEQSQAIASATLTWERVQVRVLAGTSCNSLHTKPNLANAAGGRAGCGSRRRQGTSRQCLPGNARLQPGARLKHEAPQGRHSPARGVSPWRYRRHGRRVRNAC